MSYKLFIKTGNISGAGTDANVFIKIYGNNYNTNEIKLTGEIKSNLFEKGNTDSFKLDLDDFGNIKKISIWHDGKYLGSDWFLENIILENLESGIKWYFSVNKWLKKNDILSLEPKPFSKYEIEITTGTLAGSGTDSDILLSIIGSKSKTNFIQLNSYLKNNQFKTGHTNSFFLILEDVGNIKELQLQSSKSSLNANWFLNRIKIKRENETNFSIFSFFNWIKPDEIYFLHKDLTEYTISIETGNVAGGGTDANVSMIIYGSKRKTETIRLNELITRNAFEAGQTDFLKIAQPDLGIIKKIKIWHDEKFVGDGWFLNKITVSNPNKNEVNQFPFYSWLDKSENPKSTSITLTKEPVKQRPFYCIAHMVNTPAYVEEALDMGTNSIEFDITAKLDENGNFKFEVFHGFRPDFDPDKINLMERSIARTDLEFFLQKLKEYEDKYPKLTLFIFDCKVGSIQKNKLRICGNKLADLVIKNFYSVQTNKERVYSIISIGKKKSTLFVDGFFERILEEYKKYIGADFSEENFQTTENIFTRRTENNFWWGHGIASIVPKPLTHFIPQFLIAAKKRAKRRVVKKIYYWTLDDPDSMARILVTKLDGIIVNDPLKLLRVLEKQEFLHTYRLATRDDNPFEVI